RAARGLRLPARPHRRHQVVAVPGDEQGLVLKSGREVKARRRNYMDRRYCPPTSNSACVICPSEHTRTASISTAKTFPSWITACCSRCSICADSDEFLF